MRHPAAWRGLGRALPALSLCHRVVAVKLLLAGRFASPESTHGFEREARAAARLHHPNIVAIHEFSPRSESARTAEG